MIRLSGDWQRKFREMSQSLRAAQDAARRVTSGSGDPEMLRRVGDVDAKQNAQAFKTEGAKSGAAWPDLLQGEGNMRAYAQWKRRNWPNRKLNVWRGDTRDSLTQAGATGRIVRQAGGTIELGTSAPLAAKMQAGEKHGAWQRAFLKESAPVFPKGSRKRKRRDASGKFTGETERTKGGRVVRGRNWFVFWYKTIPARPVVRKSAVQFDQLKLAVARELTLIMSREAGRSSPLGRYLSRVAGEMKRADPRL